MRRRRHYIIEKDGRSLYINNGVVSSTNNRVPLTHGPTGFNDFSLTWERDIAKNSVGKSASVALGFVNEDASILRDQFYKSNIERELYLLTKQHEIEYPEPGQYRHAYKHLHKGQFDFTTWQDDGTVVRLKVNEGGVSRKLKANGSTVYDLPIEELDYDLLKMDGVMLQMKHNFLVIEHSAKSSHFVSASPTTREGQASGFASFDVFGTRVPTGYNYVDGDDYLFTTTQELSGIQIKGTLKFVAGSSAPAYDFYLHTSENRNIVLVEKMGLTAGQTYEIPFDVTFDAHKGEKFYLLGLWPDGIFSINYKEFDFSIAFKSKYPTTYVKALRPSVVFRALLRMMGIPEDAAITSYVEQFDDYVLLSGDANRGIAGAVLKTSFDKFFQFCKVVMAAGQGVVKEKVTIQNYDYFYRTTGAIRIPRMKNLVDTVANEFLFNTVKIGSPSQQIDDVNGRFSMNNTHVYGTPITAVSKELNLVMDYITDPYVMELHRLNLEGKNTTDSQKDNTVFVADTTLNTIHFSGNALIDTASEPYISFSGNTDKIDLLQPGQRFTILNSQNNNTTLTVVRTELITGGFNVYVKEAVTTEAAINITIEVKYRTLRRESYDSIEGIPEVSKDSIFNLSLNPGVLIRRHMKYINSVLYNFPGEYLRFISTERNRSLRTVRGSTVFDQDADIAIGSERLFLPIFLDLDSQEPANLIDELEEDPDSPFVFGSVLGFLHRAGVQPSTHQEQAYKLLAGPDTNLLTIHRDAYHG